MGHALLHVFFFYPRVSTYKFSSTSAVCCTPYAICSMILFAGVVFRGVGDDGMEKSCWVGERGKG